MVHSMRADSGSAIISVISWLAKNPGHSVVLTPSRHLANNFELFSLNDSHRPSAYLSIVICTYERPDSLGETLDSLSKQTFNNFEVILITEKGHLSSLRQKGLRIAKGTFVSFIDDDVYCPPTWAQSVIEGFRKKEVVGVTGPTTITEEYQRNRDTFRFKRVRKFQEWLFEVSSQPSALSKYGTPSMASNLIPCAYEGPAQYLECCNMSVRRKEALSVGGFDHHYTVTSEWCEVDLALKLGSIGTLWFSPHAKLFHRPSQAGVYRRRLSTRHRFDNFLYFQRRWIKPSFRQKLYWGWVWLYLILKQIGLI